MLGFPAQPRTSVALLALLLFCGMPREAFGQGRAANLLAAARGLELLEEGIDAAGDLTLDAVLVMDGVTSEGAAGQLDVLVDLSRLKTLARFRVSVVIARLDDEPLFLHEEPLAQDLGTAAEWLFRQFVELPEDLLEVAVVVDELETGLWGSVVARFGEESLEATGSRLVRFAAAGPETVPITAPSPRQDSSRASPPTAAPARAPGRRSPRSGSVIQILPPRKQPVTGSVRIQTLTSDGGIRKVVFYLDGTEASVDEDAPFSATLDLGTEERPHSIRVEAFGFRDLPLGEDSILVNQLGAPFRVRIARLDGAVGAGPLDIAAQISVPPDADLDRVEFYLGDRLLDTLRKPPFQVRFDSAGATAQDFVRVVAYLGDGTSLDDARLLSDTGVSERVEVNLVELYVIVTDKEGNPRDDLAEENFTIRYRGQDRPIERFGLAEEVPLDLGLVIDTSESMWVLMPDTKKAGAQFLTQILEPGDEAFLVDFDTQPRLAHPSTGDVGSLIRSFVRLSTKGFTAMYDAIIFSMLQFEGGDGRRALILLTDGDDYRSRFSQRRCIDYSQELGVPVYIIGLGGIHSPRGGLRKIDLEGITEVSGGRMEYISSIDELAPAYQRIENELRSQYLLTFSTDRPLTRRELLDVKVRVAGRGFKVRTVVGARPGDGAPAS